MTIEIDYLFAPAVPTLGSIIGLILGFVARLAPSSAINEIFGSVANSAADSIIFSVSDVIFSHIALIIIGLIKSNFFYKKQDLCKTVNLVVKQKLLDKRMENAWRSEKKSCDTLDADITNL